MNKKFSIFFATIIVVLSMFSCVPRSSYTLLYDMKPDSLYSAKYAELSKVKVGDRIGIVVRSKNPELAKPFNSLSGNIVVGSSGIADVNVSEPNYGTRQKEVERIASSSSTDNYLGGFLVAEDGSIMYPILGKIYVKGLTLSEISDKIKNQIIKEGYINDPMVETVYTDFRVYFINGTSGTIFNVGNERLNIIQAVTRGLQASPNYRVDHIAVIRQNEEGKSQIYFCNLLNTDIFNSPVFYLQPGDIVYMQPKSQPAQTVDLDNIFRYTSYIFTTIFTVTSILNIFNK